MITRDVTSYDTGTAVTTTDTLFVGATIALHSHSTRVMSDVWEHLPYATVWNAATGAVEVVWVGKGPSAVDATPDALAAADGWLLTAATAARKAVWDARVDKAVADAHRVAVGKTVTVVKGRKVAKGTTGLVFWLGAGKNYGPVPRYRGGWSTAAPMRLGLKDADGTVHWTAASNVEVVNADDYFTLDLTTEPDHAADTAAALSAPAVATRYGGNGKYPEVSLGAGEDRIGFSDWFSGAAPAALAA